MIKTRWLCITCYERERRNGTLEDWPLMRVSRDDLAEDIRFLAANNVVAASWPQRTGKTASAIERALYRTGDVELARAMSRVRREQNGGRRARSGVL